jgi:hypothetical protein
MADRPIPLLGDISLDAVHQIEHALDAGFAATPIAGLAGALQQRTNRLSHRVHIRGTMMGEGAADALGALQAAATAGEELTFAADITRALDLQKVVIASFHATEIAGRPGSYAYDVWVEESPPLPPPAEVSGFGGLDDFGLGDLGFDTDLLGDLADAAGAIAGAVEDALAVVDALGALANLDGLSLGNVLQPMSDAADRVGELGSAVQGAFRGLSDALS